MVTRKIKIPKKPTRNFKQPSLVVHKKEEFYSPIEIKRDKKFLLPLLIGCFIFASTSISFLIPSLIAFVSNPRNATSIILFALTMLTIVVASSLTIFGIIKKRKSKSKYEEELYLEREKEQKAISDMNKANIEEKERYDSELEKQENIFQTEYDIYRLELRDYEVNKSLYIKEYEEDKKRYGKQLNEAIDIYMAMNKKWFPNIDIDGNDINGIVSILSRGLADNAKEALRLYRKQEEQCASCSKCDKCLYKKSNLGDCPSFSPLLER